MLQTYKISTPVWPASTGVQLAGQRCMLHTAAETEARSQTTCARNGVEAREEALTVGGNVEEVMMSVPCY